MYKLRDQLVLALCKIESFLTHLFSLQTITSSIFDMFLCTYRNPKTLLTNCIGLPTRELDNVIRRRQSLDVCVGK